MQSMSNGVLVWRPSFAVVPAGLIFLAASLTPSLLPRPWYLQGVVSGVAIALGYGVGATLGALSGWGRRASNPSPALRIGVLVAASLLVVWAIVVHYRWQVDVRRLMEMERGVALYIAAALPTALAASYVLLLTARLVRNGFRGHVRLLQRVMPRIWAIVAGLVSTLVFAVIAFDVLIADRLVSVINQAYLESDRRFDVDVRQPSSPHRAGGPGSLIEWESMGRQGRAFVTQGPDRDELQEFGGEPAIEPIRVYAGLQSADSAADRAELAVAELERTGAFDREVLLLIAPTGTGWIDPYAVDPLEYMYRGDTAAVAIQYSHLPSWALIVGNQDLAVHASVALFEAVSRRLEELPPPSRPHLLIFGESLGSFGWEEHFQELTNVERRTDGVLWVGPPRFNRLWQTLVFQRQEGSPLWRPVFQDGRTVRFGPDGAILSALPGSWHSPRVVYLQHASDPITWLSLDLFFQQPEWMEGPRGPDVSEEMPYIPVVTFWQLVVDLVMGTNAPIGHGHKFGPAQAEAWSLILPPDGWTSVDSERLLATVIGDG
jgi:uncharacterized membrane protein